MGLWKSTAAVDTTAALACQACGEPGDPGSLRGLVVGEGQSKGPVWMCLFPRPCLDRARARRIGFWEPAGA